MKTSALLAVLGVVCVSIQEALSSGYNYAGPLQHRYVGPLASTIPAGVDGTITPVGDTPEVAAARGAFFRAYRAQLAAVGGAHPTPATFVRPFVGPYSAPVAHYAHSFGAPVQGGDTPEVAAAKAEFFRLYNEMAAAAAAAPDYDTPHHY